jgi:hypothetical protein
MEERKKELYCFGTRIKHLIFHFQIFQLRNISTGASDSLLFRETHSKHTKSQELHIYSRNMAPHHAVGDTLHFVNLVVLVPQLREYNSETVKVSESRNYKAVHCSQ